eukprot:SAG11_NODE_2926_length_2833_cov_2.590344_3_plen_86_part_00
MGHVHRCGVVREDVGGDAEACGVVEPDGPATLQKQGRPKKKRGVNRPQTHVLWCGQKVQHGMRTALALFDSKLHAVTVSVVPDSA